jgi:hypothetical protein
MGMPVPPALATSQQKEQLDRGWRNNPQ